MTESGSAQPQRLDQATIERARNEQSLVGLVVRRVKLRRAGRGWSGLCPFHDEKTPSFTVSDEKGFFHCFGCGAHGDAIEWMQKAEGLDFRESVKALLGGSLPDARTPMKAERREAAARPVDFVSSAHAGRWIFRTSGPARGEIVERWLESRGCDPALEPLPGFPAIDLVRFHPRCPWSVWKVGEEPENHWLSRPAMVVPIADADGAIWGVHVTYLSADGRAKAQLPRTSDGKVREARKIFGRVQGFAALLTPAEALCSGEPLAVGEGFETTWSFVQEQRRPMRAAAALSLRNLQGYEKKLRDGAVPLWKPEIDRDHPQQPFTLPDPEDVVIAIDADMKPLRNQRVQLARGAQPVIADISGMQRAEICAELAAQAWRRAGARSVCCVRPRMGADFNDVLRTSLNAAPAGGVSGGQPAKTVDNDSLRRVA